MSAAASYAAPSLGQPAASPFVNEERISHPPGYQQDPNASVFSSHQRAAHQALESFPRGTGGNASDFGEEEGVWDSAKKFMMAAGDRLSAAESEVWRRINK